MCLVGQRGVVTDSEGWLMVEPEVTQGCRPLGRCVSFNDLLFSSAVEGSIPPAQDVADLHLPVFGDEPPPGDKSAKTGDAAVSGSGAKLAAPFMLGESLPPIPAKLVVKIQKGDFVDMAELLRDNVEADRRHTRDGSASNLSEHQVQS